jgi:beta-carotene ketolase (CrtW type)
MGILIATTIVLLWAGHLVWSLAFVEVSATSPMMLVHIAVQTYLYTGLFITSKLDMKRVVYGNI